MTELNTDLLGFRCEFVTGMITPRAQTVPRCRPCDNRNLDACPGTGRCSKPEACRAMLANRHRRH
ncbi:hypothetical protein NX722_13510 [Endozoicomonas gorgoniicola]|uniref:Uncharacterized protein n=1 Tax=Endozoicomonas gorgoniicola TaxID=1234144 RepID=A0ABT3MW71_9GAMM|nr:hypothetical protein [Endozoicomonas gorgoniicola]MCW7553625.1 hypothetical protein [Endozoicomonas gorgoniicola]